MVQVADSHNIFYKTKKENMIIGVTGCFAQEQGEELANKFKQIDLLDVLEDEEN